MLPLVPEIELRRQPISGSPCSLTTKDDLRVVTFRESSDGVGRTRKKERCRGVANIGVRAREATSQAEGADFVHVEPNSVELNRTREVQESLVPPVLRLGGEPIREGLREGEGERGRKGGGEKGRYYVR